MRAVRSAARGTHRPETRIVTGVLVAACILLTALAAGRAWAADGPERITDYASTITVNEDASLTVTETITVNVRGQKIRHGIYRDFPTSYRSRNGSRVRVGFDVRRVTLDGAPEHYTIETISDGKRVRIGSADQFVPSGVHTYRITYTTTRQLGFFQDHDELYWNVTGDKWDFAIDKAEADVKLPSGAHPLELTAYTGKWGARGTAYRARDTVFGPHFETTAPLAPGEGFTIVVAWPKGFVTPPTAAENAFFLLRDNAGTLVGLLSVFGVSLFYFIAWSRYGRDPQKGVIFPRYEPPTGLSAAACRFIRRMDYDRKAFTAALINMATKKYLTIKEEDGHYSLVKNGDAAAHSLSNGERKIANSLFRSRDSITLKNTNHTTISQSITALKNSLQSEFETQYFVRNFKLFLAGLGLSALCVLLALVLSDNAPVQLFLGVWLTGWTVACFFLVTTMINQWRNALTTPGPLTLNKIFSTTGAIFSTLFALPFVIAEIVVFGVFASQGGSVTALLLVCLGALNVAFYHLLKAPTLAGRTVMDEIEGFRDYLSVAEQNRLNILTGPDRTPELFEKYLPYALALDVENRWAEGFADVLASASTEPGGTSSGYHPSWYQGRSWSGLNTTAFVSSLGASLGASVASAATPPGSSSGSGGGGFSGGGGGGGGGGGW